jgi:hypothetical protein
MDSLSEEKIEVGAKNEKIWREIQNLREEKGRHDASLAEEERDLLEKLQVSFNHRPLLVYRHHIYPFISLQCL